MLRGIEENKVISLKKSGIFLPYTYLFTLVNLKENTPKIWSKTLALGLKETELQAHCVNSLFKNMQTHL